MEATCAVPMDVLSSVQHLCNRLLLSEIQDHLVHQDLQDPQEQVVHPEDQVAWDHQEVLEIQDQQVAKDPKVDQDHQDLLVPTLILSVRP